MVTPAERARAGIHRHRPEPNRENRGYGSPRSRERPAGQFFPLKSTMRFALPAERSTPPGGVVSTVAVTPISALIWCARSLLHAARTTSSAPEIGRAV